MTGEARDVAGQAEPPAPYAVHAEGEAGYTKG